MQKKHTACKDQRYCHPERLPADKQATKRSLRECIDIIRFPRAFALVIALGLVAFIMIATINLASDMMEHAREFAEIEQTTEAYYAAEAALEVALLMNKGKGPGYEARVECNAQGVCIDQNGYSSTDGINFIEDNGAYGTWTVQGRTWCLWSDPLKRDVCDNLNIFYIPYPGTGMAGTTCDPLGAYPDKDHACNWGKIGYGETIMIPLHRAIAEDDQDVSLDINGDFILDPSELGLYSLNIKIRTPCKDRSNECEGDMRYELYIPPGVKLNVSDTMMIWEITGTCVRTSDKVEKKCYLGQIEEEEDFDKKEATVNSEIYADLINNGDFTNYIVVDTDQEYGDDNFKFRNLIIKFLKNEWRDNNDSDESQVSSANQAWQWDDRRLTQPFLKLSVIQTMIDADNPSKTIPYLEYQIETYANAPGADVYQTMIGEGYSGNFKQSVEMKKGHKTGVLQFAVQN